jgi:uncharacterized protein YkwD
MLLLAASAMIASALTGEEQELANLLTGDRGQRRDTRRMVLDPILTSVARARAADMAHRRYFAHVNPDGIGPNWLLRAAGYELPSFWGRSRSQNFVESIGGGYTTPAAAWDGWMHSTPHRTHLLAQSGFYRDQTNFGVGVYSDPSSPLRRYWVIITAPPSQRMAAVSQTGTRMVRVATSAPAGTEDEDAPVSVPRPSAVRMRNPPGKLWNSDEPADAVPVSAPRPSATRIIGAG